MSKYNELFWSSTRAFSGLYYHRRWRYNGDIPEGDEYSGKFLKKEVEANPNMFHEVMTLCKYMTTFNTKMSLNEILA